MRKQALSLDKFWSIKNQGVFDILQDDRAYINEMLAGLPAEDQTVILRKYFSIWKETMLSDDSHNRQNTGRKAANGALKSLILDSIAASVGGVAYE